MSQYQSLVADYAVAVTPSDSTVLAPTLGLFIGTAGNITVTMATGALVTFTGVLAGQVLPVRVTKVMAATTATAIVALW